LKKLEEKLFWFWFCFCSGATAMRRATTIAAKTNAFRRTWEEVTDAFNKLSVKKLLRFDYKKKIFLIMKQTRFYQLFQTESFCIFYSKKQIFLIMKQTRFYQLFQTKCFCIFDSKKQIFLILKRTGFYQSFQVAATNPRTFPFFITQGRKEARSSFPIQSRNTLLW